jgi:hypothetical protein
MTYPLHQKISDSIGIKERNCLKRCSYSLGEITDETPKMWIVSWIKDGQKLTERFQKKNGKGYGNRFLLVSIENAKKEIKDYYKNQD